MLYIVRLFTGVTMLAKHRTVRKTLVTEGGMLVCMCSVRYYARYPGGYAVQVLSLRCWIAGVVFLNPVEGMLCLLGVV